MICSKPYKNQYKRTTEIAVRKTCLGKVGEEHYGRKEDNGLLVDNIEFLRNSGGDGASSENSSAGLRDEAG